MDATIIYPHQLFATSPAVAEGRVIYLVEESLILTHNPIHRQKLMFHKLSLDAYQRHLDNHGHQVIRLSISDYPTTASVFEKLESDGVSTLHIVDTTDDYLESAIADSGIAREWYDSPLFLLSKSDATMRFTAAKRKMATFYKQLRQDLEVLIDKNGKPVGGQWSFDEDNRKKIPKDTTLPEDIAFFGNQATADAESWADELETEVYGTAGCWLPYTHDGATQFLHEFLATRFHDFGPYEDAMTTGGVRLWHSALSPLLNVGLLTPRQVLDAALAYATEHDVPINSQEGFIRQLIGWREFMRASYEVDGQAMRTKNFFGHTRLLPASFWDGTTGLPPVDRSITTALKYGYTHHIERLMVMGNVLLLCQIDPDEVYRWFMGMYLDAYDWVMVPNVYGMSQFADGGSFATKPYISGANYIRKMSDYDSGDWEDSWTALYWYFISTHHEVFSNNHRMSMMPRLLERMKDDTKREHFERAKTFLSSLD